MIYVFFLLDRPGSAQLRRDVRPQHKAYLAKMADRMAFAGPLVADDGETMIGSLLAIDSIRARPRWTGSPTSRSREPASTPA